MTSRELGERGALVRAPADDADFAALVRGLGEGAREHAAREWCAGKAAALAALGRKLRVRR